MATASCTTPSVTLIEPLIERTFIADSYANRLGKGTHRALQRAQELARRYPYVLQCDLRQFFPSIDHAILRHILARKIADTDVLWLIERILASGQGVLRDAYDMVYFPGDDLFAALRPRGLPIGNLTSQFWANVYLNSFDHFIKRTLCCQGYVRYVDDFLLFGADKPTLWNWKTAVQERLATLRLTMHPGAHPRPVAEGIPFLGFVIFPQRRRLKRRKGVYFHSKLRRLLAAAGAGDMPLTRVTASVQAWVNHVRYGNTVGLRKAVLQGPHRVFSPPRRQRMSLTPDTWKTTFTERLSQWRQRMQQGGVTSVYAFVSAMALWPVAAALHGGDLGAVAALGGVLAGVGSKLLANCLQHWKDETDAAQQLTAEVNKEPQLRTKSMRCWRNSMRWHKRGTPCPKQNASGSLTRSALN